MHYSFGVKNKSRINYTLFAFDLYNKRINEIATTVTRINEVVKPINQNKTASPHLSACMLCLHGQRSEQHPLGGGDPLLERRRLGVRQRALAILLLMPFGSSAPRGAQQLRPEAGGCGSPAPLLPPGL
jgi:hypothetical protein